MRPPHFNVEFILDILKNFKWLCLNFRWKAKQDANIALMGINLNLIREHLAIVINDDDIAAMRYE